MPHYAYDGQPKISIYISTDAANLELAKLVLTQLEGESYHVWIGEQRSEDDWENIQRIVDDALRFADANVLLVLEGGDPNKIEAARQRQLPVLILKTGASLTDSLAELKRIALQINLPTPAFVPAPIEAAHVIAHTPRAHLGIGIGRLNFRLLLALLLNLPTLLVMALAWPPRVAIPLDWIQILLFSVVLSITAWAYLIEGSRP